MGIVRVAGNEQLVCSIAPVEAVLRLAREYPVFPCRLHPTQILWRGERKVVKAKSPLTPHGFQDASQDPDQIRAWWREHPDALVGVPTGPATGFLVVDYDEYKADAAAKDWIAENSVALCETRSHATLSGGRHYLFRVTPTVEYRGGVSLALNGKVRVGLDLRASGGYVIWWPLHGGSASGETILLPAGLIDERKVEPRALEPLPAATPASWGCDRQTLLQTLPWIDPVSYGAWIDAGMAISLACGGVDDGFALWHAWSAGELTGECPVNYAGIHDCRYRWASFRHDKARGATVTVGTLVHRARAAALALKTGMNIPENIPAPQADIPPLSTYEEEAKRFADARADQANVSRGTSQKIPSQGRENPAADGQEKDDGELGLSDDELALRFTARYGKSLRYVAAWDRWLLWDGKRWAHDEKRSVFDLSRAICREVLAEHLAQPLTDTQRKGLRKRLGDAKTVYNITKLAGSDPVHAVSVRELDADPWALNTPAGILDLRTGLMRPHDPCALHTKMTAAAPGGECPIFIKTLTEALPADEVKEYVQRLFGYGLTGSSRDHALSFWWGSGRNGKGTIAHAFRRALGDYGLEVGAELFMESHHERHPTEIAVLRGARFVVASEIDTGRRWNEARLKRLTGGDPISARYIGKDLFEFEPTHTLLIIGNTKPGLRSVDEAMRARMQLVEFGVTIDALKRDTELPDKLAAEYGGVLAWALKGCITWRREGLKPPASVLASTADYLDAEDSIAQWVNEACEKAGQLKLSAGHRSYREWCEKNAAPPLGRNAFTDQLEAHGFKRSMDNRGKSVVFIGISLPMPKDHMRRAEEDEDAKYAREKHWSDLQ